MILGNRQPRMSRKRLILLMGSGWAERNERRDKTRKTGRGHKLRFREEIFRSHNRFFEKKYRVFRSRLHQTHSARMETSSQRQGYKVRSEGRHPQDAARNALNAREKKAIRVQTRSSFTDTKTAGA